MFDFKDYITESQKKSIEAIPQHLRWGGYKNVNCNLQLWQLFWKKVYQGSQTDEILDYGSGAAWSNVVGRKLGYQNIRCLDINTPEATEQFNKWHDILDNKVTFWDGKSMSFEDNQFDAIIAKASVTKLRNSDWPSFYREMTRVSKPKCRWFIAPDYMVDRMPNKKKWLKKKGITIFVWDWDRNHKFNNVYHPELNDKMPNITVRSISKVSF